MFQIYINMKSNFKIPRAGKLQTISNKSHTKMGAMDLKLVKCTHRVNHFGSHGHFSYKTTLLTC